MRNRQPGIAAWAALSCVLACSQGSVTPDAALDAAADADAPVAFVEPFDLTVLHRIDIRTDAAGEAQLRAEDLVEERVPCDIVFDGQRFPNSGIRAKGHSSRSWMKPGLSIKFDQFVPGQQLAGMDKILLNNSEQDTSMLNEHIAYAVFRAAGVVAPRTAHALVSLNGQRLGFYVIREAIERAFLRRNFGAGHTGGNLYEGSGDFVTNPDFIALAHEKTEARSRTDVKALADLVKEAPEATFIEDLPRKLDLDKFLTAHAVMSILGYTDSYVFNSNNYYLYDNPQDGRFLLIPHGADEIFCPLGRWTEGGRNWTICDPLRYPDDPPIQSFGRLAQRIRHTPLFDEKFRQELRRVNAVAFDVAAISALIDQAMRVVLSANDGSDPTGRWKLAFTALVDQRRELIARLKEQVDARLR